MENKYDHKNNCPVCGFGLKWDLDEATSANEICPSCGTQFGYDDAIRYKRDELTQLVYRNLRKKWIEDGMRWDKGQSDPPEDWNPEEQLENVPDEFK